MGFLYPDNENRARRLQQLIDSMVNMQTDIKHVAEEMDKLDKRMRPTIDKLLHDNHMNGIDDLIKKAMEKMTPEEKKQFEAMIAAAKKFDTGIDITYFIGGLLFLPEGLVLSGKLVLAVGKYIGKLAIVLGVAKVFRIAAGGAEAASAAAAAASQLEKAAMEAEAITKEAGLGAEAGAEVAEASRIFARVSKFVKILGIVGFVLTIVVFVIEAIEGAQQRARFIEAIQNAQPSRLCIARYKREAMSIQQNMTTMSTYLDALTDGEQEAANYMSKKIIKNIQEQVSQINWNDLEIELERQDRQAGSYYGGDDLSTVDVIDRATKLHDEENK
ncbi:hypothetical protein CC2G_010964 [Coprinopsis cinerea AmutBmut pab1-1]|nr:hypothetical protein CC2G_010964 [Coprinopsis cinerea AmutBmut pab1-1]